MNTLKNNNNILTSREENQLNIREFYLEIEFSPLDNAGGIIANNANVKLVNYGGMALFSSNRLQKISGKTIEFKDHCYPNLSMYKLLTSTSNEYESGFVRDQIKRDSQLKCDHQAAQRCHMYMRIKMKDQFGFIIDLEKIVYGIGFKLILERNSNDRGLFRVNAGIVDVAINCNLKIRDIG